ncbi:MAG: hypothetical protein LIP12_07925 [Clostridiales bacterium]|nr:hypothetical protein [Clostridiales bacterium]
MDDFAAIWPNQKIEPTRSACYDLPAPVTICLCLSRFACAWRDLSAPGASSDVQGFTFFSKMFAAIIE